MALITLSELGNHIGKTLTGDTRATQIVASVNEQVANYIGRLFGTEAGGETVTETLDYKPVIFLKYLDVKSITSIKVEGNTLTESQYTLNKDIGRIVLSTGANPASSTRQGYDAVELEYKAGVETTPADLKLACLQLASDNYNKKDTVDSAGVTSANVGGLSLSFGTSTQAGNRTSPDGSHSVADYVSILNYYRRRRLS